MPILSSSGVQQAAWCYVSWIPLGSWCTRRFCRCCVEGDFPAFQRLWQARGEKQVVICHPVAHITQGICFAFHSSSYSGGSFGFGTALCASVQSVDVRVGPSGNPEVGAIRARHAILGS